MCRLNMNNVFKHVSEVLNNMYYFSVFRTQNLSSRLIKCLFPLVTISSMLSVAGLTSSSSVTIRDILVVNIAQVFVFIIDSALVS